MRLNNYISQTGLCSRREADRLIEDKRVLVNNEIAQLGLRVSDLDEVMVDGKPLKKVPKSIYIALNKPVGITCTTERHIKGNIIDFVNHKERIFPIGRLDKDSEGLILLTNDGDIVNHILREENNNEKEYIVQVNKKIDNRFIRNMSNGVRIYNPVRKEHAITKKCKVDLINSNTFKITLSQGLNRQIRRMCSKLGYNVVSLKRISIMHIKLEGLKVGQWRNLTKEEVIKLKE